MCRYELKHNHRKNKEEGRDVPDTLVDRGLGLSGDQKSRQDGKTREQNKGGRHAVDSNDGQQGKRQEKEPGYVKNPEGGYAWSLGLR